MKYECHRVWRLNYALKGFFLAVSIILFSVDAMAAQISSIDVKGNRRIESATVRAYLPIQIGDEYDNAKIDEALKTLFSTGLFSDVKISQQGTRLIVKVSENPIIVQVSFEGNDSLSSESLTPLINLESRSVYNRVRVLLATQTIIQQYRRQGYYRVRVEPKIIELDSSRVNVVFEIDESRKNHVEKIYFLGNKVFSNTDLHSAIATTEYKFWKFLSVTDVYDPDRLEFDKQVLRNFYTRRGFADFTVEAVLAERNISSDGFYITFVINEGARYRFGEDIFRIKIPGVTKDNFTNLIEYDVGDIFDGFQIGKSRDAINEKAQSLGYAFIDVRPSLETDRKKNIVQVVWNIAEAPRSYVEKIQIRGNSHTEDSVIRREFRLQEGDAFNRTLIAQTERQIRALGFFDNVLIEPRSGSAADKVVLDVSVAERPTGSISLGAGYSTNDGLIGDFSISESNFQGRGQTLSVAFNYSVRRKNVNLSFIEPYFLGYRLRFGSNAFYQLNNLVRTRGYKLDRSGFSFSLRFPLKEDFYLTTLYKLQNDKLHSSTININEGNTLESILGYRITYDLRNDVRNTSEGFFIQLGQDYAGAGGQAFYMRTTADFRWYTTLADVVSGKYIFASRFSLGSLHPLGDYQPLSLNNFFLGAGNLRGFGISGAGPRRSNGSAVGARLYGILSNELRISSGFLAQIGLTPIMFLDTAIIGDSGADTRRYYAVRGMPVRDSFALRMSAGFSLLWESPLGPLRFDFSDVLIKERYDDEQNFHFQIGVSF